MAIDQAKDAMQKARAALDSLLAPLQIFFRRRGEKRVHARSVAAVFFGHVDGADDVTFGFGHLGAVLQHHALGKKAAHRLAGFHQAQVVHDFAEKSRINQVQDGVFDAADVLVDGKPVAHKGGIERRAVVVRIGVAEEIPRRIDECIHGVGLATARGAAFGALHVHKRWHIGERRLALPGEQHVFRQAHGQIFIRYRNDPALPAIDDRNRRAPVTLARNAPILQAIGRLCFADALGLCVGGHLLDGRCSGEAAIGA